MNSSLQKTWNKIILSLLATRLIVIGLTIIGTESLVISNQQSKIYSASTTRTLPIVSCDIEIVGHKSRRQAFKIAATFLMLATPSLDSNADAAIASYSSNARNMERLASGDSSGGSTYDNYPKTIAGQKRRAMTGCKIPSAREQAGVENERECNLKVMNGDTEFMLNALVALDCPTCPYGVSPKAMK